MITRADIRQAGAWCLLCTLISGAALLLVATLSGCNSRSGTVALPQIPAWRAPADPRPVPYSDLLLGVMRLAPKAQLVTSDAVYTPINATFARELITWTRSFLWTENKEGGGFAWTAESLDCDKFAKAFTLAVEVAAARAGVKAQPLALRISVEQRQPFGGVPATGPPWSGHALVALVTDAGILVVEPQGGAEVPLEQYPNRAWIWRVAVGG